MALWTMIGAEWIDENEALVVTTKRGMEEIDFLAMFRRILSVSRLWLTISLFIMRDPTDVALTVHFCMIRNSLP